MLKFSWLNWMNLINNKILIKSRFCSTKIMLKMLITVFFDKIKTP